MQIKSSTFMYFETEKSGDAHEEVRNLKNYSKLKDARVITITIKE
jgi:hypothetical protein